MTVATDSHDTNEHNDVDVSFQTASTEAFDPFTDDQVPQDGGNSNLSFDAESRMVHLMGDPNVENDGFQDEGSSFGPVASTCTTAAGSKIVNTPTKAVRTPISSRDCLPDPSSQIFQVWIVIREEMNCVFNHFTKKYSTHTEGSIEVSFSFW